MLAKERFAERLDNNARRTNVYNNLHELKLLLERHSLTVSAEQVQEKITDLRATQELLVFVFGEGNFGKSSLINSLCGRDVAPISFLPKTWRIDLYRPVSDYAEEFAFIRRKGHPNFERFSLTGAKVECEKQEHEIDTLQKATLTAENEKRRLANQKPLARTDLPPVQIENQIVEVQWHYKGLALPANIVLVDTPGYDQVRAELKTSRSNTLSSNQGLVFDLHEIYEQFYHRATLVLWAFRADKLNDGDTVKKFNELSNRGKDVIGVITYTDKVAPERRTTELLPNAQRYFGHGVIDFVPVICGGNSPEKGLGIGDLRGRLTALGPNAESLKMREAEIFCKKQAKFALSHVNGIAETLIHNIQQIAHYCNGTCESLLRETKKSHKELLSTYLKQIRAPQLNKQQFDIAWTGEVTNLLNALANDSSIRFSLLGVAREDADALNIQFGRRINSILHVKELETLLQDTLGRVGKYVRLQGTSVAANQQMRQIILQAGGSFKTQRMTTQIEMPDTRRISVKLPQIQMPQLPGGAMNNVLRLFGKASVAESAVSSTISKLWETVNQLVGEQENGVILYTKQVANAILASADTALATVYPKQTFASLREKCRHFDSDIARLSEMSDEFTAPIARSDKVSYRYETVFRIWSPRDDIRAAAIDLFCEWFNQQWPVQQEQAQQLIVPVLKKKPLRYKYAIDLSRRVFSTNWGKTVSSAPQVSEQIARLKYNLPQLAPKTIFTYLSRFTWMVLMTCHHKLRRASTEKPAYEIDEVRMDVFYHKVPKSIDTSIAARRAELSALLQQEPIFDDAAIARQILQDFEYMNLNGIGIEFSRYAAAKFEQTDADLFQQIIVPPLRSKANVYFLWPQSASISVISVSGLVGFSEFTIGTHFFLHISPITLSLLPLGLATITAPLIVLALQKYEQTLHRSNLTKQVARILHEKADQTNIAAWRITLASFDGVIARKIVGKKTLVEKKPLDYAIEGAFKDYK